MESSKQFLLLIVTALIVCAVPVLFFSEQRQEQLTTIATDSLDTDNQFLTISVIIGLFASDILLPVPSSAVCAIAGRYFGWALGSLLCWFGLNISALIGYWLGRLLGWEAVKRFSDEPSVLAAKQQVDRWGIWPLVAFRPLPVLSEASILLLGTYHYSQRRFWPPILFANGVVAAIFVAVGTWFSHNNMFAIGIVVACTIPTLGLIIWMYFAPKSPGQLSDQQNSGSDD